MVVWCLSVIALGCLSYAPARAGPVMHAHHPGLVGPGADPLQVDPAGKDALSLAYGDGMDQQHILVNQAEPHKRLRGANAAGHAQVLPWLLLDLVHGCSQVVITLHYEQLGMLP